MTLSSCLLRFICIIELQIVLRAELITRVDTVVDDAVLLPCDIESSDPAAKVKVVLWYRGNSSEVIFSYDARKSKMEEGMSWSDESLLGKRAHFQSVAPYGLLIKHISASDEGIYRCRVDFTTAPTRNLKIYLWVAVPPKAPIIKDKDRIIQEFVGPYAENDNLILVCESYGARPLPILTWFREGSLVKSFFESIGTVGSRSTLKIFNLKRKDFGAKFSCQASNNKKTVPATKSVVLDMNFEPTTARILGRNFPMSEGKEYKFTCQSYGGRPPARIIWKKEENILSSESHTVSYLENVTVSTCTVRPTYLDNGKRLICNAVSPVFPGKGVQDTWVMTVYYAPRLSVQQLNPDLSLPIQEGEDVILRCDILANPSVITVKWNKNNFPILGGIEYQWFDNILSIKNITRFSSGHYSCEGSNMEGTKHSDLIYLQVDYKPICIVDQVFAFRIAINESVKINCQLNANPAITGIKWEFHGHNGNVFSEINSDLENTLIYTARTPESYGRLLCWGRNKVGEQEVPCSYEITHKNIPEIPRDCTLNESRSSALRIACQQGDDGDAPQYFVAEVIDQNTGLVVKNVRSSIPEFIVDGVDRNLDYYVNVHAVNDAGRTEAVKLERNRSEVSSSDSITQAIAGNRQMALFKITPILASLAVIVVTLMVVAVIIVVCTHRSKNRRKERENCSKGTLTLLSSNVMECYDTAETSLQTNCANGLKIVGSVLM